MFFPALLALETLSPPKCAEYHLVCCPMFPFMVLYTTFNSSAWNHVKSYSLLLLGLNDISQRRGSATVEKAINNHLCFFKKKHVFTSDHCFTYLGTKIHPRTIGRLFASLNQTKRHCYNLAIPRAVLDTTFSCFFLRSYHSRLHNCLLKFRVIVNSYCRNETIRVRLKDYFNNTENKMSTHTNLPGAQKPRNS